MIMNQINKLSNVQRGRSIDRNVAASGVLKQTVPNFPSDVADRMLQAQNYV